MDNFIVSARKYRPATFDSVVGQTHITSTLKNAVSRGQLAHAYLFCGPRGVGKTTCARIFAKAINCLSPVGSEACGECESCRAFNEGRSFNIHELDAASNNSVDDIRFLTEQVRIPPQTGRYSVYIIDEVHMLSQAAFNAFLKTLEEPPAHAIFILATTEKHKIIPTILSRCQIYDFNRIRVEDAVGYLQRIAKIEGISYDDESLNLIAAKADGGMRDALSMFDKAVAFCGTVLNFREVARTLNVLDYDTYFNITGFAAAGDYRQALLLFDEVLRKGFSAQTFVGGLASHLRDLLMCKDAATLPLLDATGTLLDRYRTQSAGLDIPFLFDAVALIDNIDATLRSSINTRLHVELGLMKLCGLGRRHSPDPTPEFPLPAPAASGASSPKQPSGAAPSRHAQGEAAGNTPLSPVGTNPVTPSPTVDSAAEALSAPERPLQHTASSPTAESRSAATGSPASEKRTADYPTPAPRTNVASAATEKESHNVIPPAEGKGGASSARPGRSLSGVSINSILNGDTAIKDNAADPLASTRYASLGIDPDSESKITAAKQNFIESLSRHRPRFATAFSAMKVTGNRISISVSTDLLRDDIVQHQKEIANLLREVSGTEGQIEFHIEVREDKSAVKPIKPEDKLAHLRGRNPMLDDLRRELDLDLE